MYSVTVIFSVPGRSRCTVACSTHGNRSTRRADRAGVDEQQVIVHVHAGRGAHLARA